MAFVRTSASPAKWRSLKWLLPRILLATACLLYAVMNTAILVAHGKLLKTEEGNAGTRISMPRSFPPLQSEKQRIAWLMSFPNSGTSYTLELVSSATQTRVATNYGSEIYRSYEPEPVSSEHPNGPFWIRDEYPNNATYPSGYALVKTHCGGSCMECKLRKYLESIYSFQRACFATDRRRLEDGKFVEHFEGYNVSKAVHVIRNPFANMVSRFHHFDNEYGRAGGNRDRGTFRRYCEFHDRTNPFDNTAAAISLAMLELQDVPCSRDLFRYVEWHNHAFLTTQELGLEVYVLHYDWYEKRFDETLAELLDFLHLERSTEEVAPFHQGKSYADYYTDEEKQRVKVAFQSMALKATWREIGRYFDH